MSVLKVACDNQVPRKCFKTISSIGCEVVMCADNYPDEYWVRVALDRGARVFISPDLDVPNLIQNEPQTFWLEYPRNLRPGQVNQFLNIWLGALRQYEYAKERVQRLQRMTPAEIIKMAGGTP